MDGAVDASGKERGWNKEGSGGLDGEGDTDGAGGRAWRGSAGNDHVHHLGIPRGGDQQVMSAGSVGGGGGRYPQSDESH